MINVNLGRNLRHEVKERDRGRMKEKSIRWGGIFHCLLGMENGRIWEVFTRKFFFFFFLKEPPNTGRASLYQKVVSLSLSFFPFSFLELTDRHQAQITLLPYPKRIALHCIFLCSEHHANNTNLIAAMSELKSPFSVKPLGTNPSILWKHGTGFS